MDNVGYEKRLTSTDVSQKLTVPGHWLQILPNIEDDNKNNVQIRALDGKGMYWEFYLSKRSIGCYKKPVFQSKEWLQFVRNNGLKAGTGSSFRKKMTILGDPNTELEFKDDEGHWDDVELQKENVFCCILSSYVVLQSFMNVVFSPCFN